MVKNANILLGCDRPQRLASILSLLRSFTEASIVTVNHHNDLFSLFNSLSPNLIILYFQNNQNAIDFLNRKSSDFGTPVLCLNGSSYNTQIHAAAHNIVFNEDENLIHNSHDFSLKIRSILRLAVQPYPANSSAVRSSSFVSSNVNNSRNLSRYVMEIEQYNQTLSKIKKRVNELSLRVDHATRSELISIVNSIKIANNSNRHWDDFKIYFENINPQFLETLSERHPCLTPKDLKYCCYLKMNMSNEDIKNLLSINSESVRTHKYRLKKKMELSKSQDLQHYLQSISRVLLDRRM